MQQNMLHQHVFFSYGGSIDAILTLNITGFVSGEKNNLHNKNRKQFKS